MANSNLVNSTKSSSYYTTRTGTIDTITLHCLPNYLTVDKIFNYCNSKQISCNYAIDKSGNVGLIVDESMASKCTADNENDNRAITIMLSAERLSPYEIYNSTYTKLISLLLDICDRHEQQISLLIWSSNADDRLTHKDGSNLNLFGDFTSEECHYNTLLSIVDDIAKKVNNQLSVDRVTDEAGNRDDGSYDTTGDLGIAPGASGSVNTVSIVNKSDIISKNAYLTKAQMEINARYIWQYLGSRGWSLNAVAGILGNMQTESTITPNRCEISDSVSGPSSSSPTDEDIEDYAKRYKAVHGRFPGYGLVQWTGQRSGGDANNWKDQKYIYWCNQQEPALKAADIDSQLERIIYEFENGIQYSNSYGHSANYPMKSTEFPTSTASARLLAETFLANYENPASPDFTLRGNQGEAWYNFLLPYSCVSPPTAYGLQILQITQESIQAKCYLQNVVTALSLTLNVLDTSGNIVSCTKTNVEPETTAAYFDAANLVPGTTYSLGLIVQATSNEDESAIDTDSENTTQETGATSITFKTPKAAPFSVSGVQITNLELPLPDKKFKIEIDPPDNWGYTAKKYPNASRGYLIQLISNGEVLASKIENNINSCKTFETTLDKNGYFKDAFNNPDHVAKPGDNIQIGVKTWINHQNDGTLYDSKYAKTSNAICLINNSHLVFINDK